MESKKRERSANFNKAEVRLLLNLVDKCKHIIENKKTDSVTNRHKDAAWKKIENSFNSCGITTTIRTWKTLKLKYEGIKKMTKKNSLQLQEMYRNGEALSNASDFNDVVEEKYLPIHDVEVVVNEMDNLSAARLELVQLQIETTRKQHQFIEDEHKLKMVYLANDEARKQELHKLMVEKLKANSSGPVLNGII